MKKMIASPRRIGGQVALVTELGFGYGWTKSRGRQEFSSIDDLSRVLDRHSVTLSRKGQLVGIGYRETPTDAFWRSGLYRTYTVLDHDDLPIAGHVVLDDLVSISRDESKRFEGRRLWRRHWPRDPATYFRNGPIPGAIFLRRRRRSYKLSGTFSEVRAAVSLDNDTEALEAGVRVRGKRSQSNIGDNDWEGIWSSRHKDKGWKRHRAAQWKS